MLAEVKLLKSFTNTRGVIPALSLIHILDTGAAWASDGDVELLIPKTTLPHSKRWATSAEELINLLNAAGDKATITLGETDARIGSADFTGVIPLDRLDKPPSSLTEAFMAAEAKHYDLANAKAFTQALRVVAPFASQDPAVGLKWTSVCIRKAGFYASNQGFGGVRAVLRDKIAFTNGKPENDIAIPSRAVLALAEAGEVARFSVAAAAGLGAFTLTNGSILTFRLIDVRGANEMPLDRMDAVIEEDPGKGAWAAAAPVKALVDRLTPLTNPKVPRVKLECDNNGWFMYTNFRSEASVNLPQSFMPNLTAQAVNLDPKLWQLILGASAEIAPDADVRFRGSFTIDKGGFDILGIMSGMADDAGLPQPAQSTEDASEMAEMPDGEPS